MMLVKKAFRRNALVLHAGSRPGATTGAAAGAGKTVQARGVTSENDSEWAATVREHWMRLMGMSAEEIRESCDPRNGPFDIQQELEELVAAQKLAERRLSYDDLSRLAREGGSLPNQP